MLLRIYFFYIITFSDLFNFQKQEVLLVMCIQLNYCLHDFIYVFFKLYSRTKEIFFSKLASSYISSTGSVLFVTDSTSFSSFRAVPLSCHRIKHIPILLNATFRLLCYQNILLTFPFLVSSILQPLHYLDYINLIMQNCNGHNFRMTITMFILLPYLS